NHVGHRVEPLAFAESLQGDGPVVVHDEAARVVDEANPHLSRAKPELPVLAACETKALIEAPKPIEVRGRQGEILRRDHGGRRRSGHEVLAMELLSKVVSISSEGGLAQPGRVGYPTHDPAAGVRAQGFHALADEVVADHDVVIDEDEE